MVMWCLYDLPKSCHRTAQPLKQYLENKKINRIILFALYNYIISIKGLHFVTGFLVIIINVRSTCTFIANTCTCKTCIYK